MPIIGITGGFGAGKSFVASIFRKLGAKVIDADKLAHKALKKGSGTYKRIVSAFGKSILDPNGAINRKALGEKVFSSKKYIKRLNNIIHPNVIRIIKDRIRVSKNEILVVDAPLICETSLPVLMNVLIVVKASRKKQIDRCVEKFNMEKKDVCKRMACQIPLKEKVARADYVIDNNGTREKTKKQVIKLWKELKKGAKVWR